MLFSRHACCSSFIGQHDCLFPRGSTCDPRVRDLVTMCSRTTSRAATRPGRRTNASHQQNVILVQPGLFRSSRHGRPDRQRRRPIPEPWYHLENFGESTANLCSSVGSIPICVLSVRSTLFSVLHGGSLRKLAVRWREPGLMQVSNMCNEMAIKVNTSVCSTSKT